MSYKYELTENASIEELEYMLKESTTLRKNHFCFTVMTRAIVMLILLIFVTMATIICNASPIYIELFVIGISIVMLSIIYTLLLHKDIGIKTIAKLIKKHWKEERNLEINSGVCNYMCGKFQAGFTKNEVVEILKVESYTFIFIAPKVLRYIFLIDPIIIPNNLFESQEKYNEFINSISK